MSVSFLLSTHYGSQEPDNCYNPNVVDWPSEHGFRQIFA